ncbi:MAG: Ldh family oxidoreductase [Chloroflexota bacterium]
MEDIEPHPIKLHERRSQMLERFKVPEADRVYVQEDRMRSATESVFRKMGLAAKDAALSADVLMTSDLRGCETHGVSNMLRRYVGWYNTGELNPRPNVAVVRESDVTATLDADNGLGLHTAPPAMEIAMEKAERHGMGAVTVKNARHLGMLAYHSMMALERDMIGVCMIAGNPLSMVPTFGAEKRFATNPWAWAAPARNMPPFVFDAATTQVAGNKLALAQRIGSKLEPAWITRKDGSIIMEETDLPPNRDDYHILPIGGTREQGSHKGYGFAAIAEIMSQILPGMGAAFLHPGTMGHFFQAYKIDAFTDLEKFKDDMDAFLGGLANTPPAPGHDRVLYPGLPEHEETEKRRREGIPYHKEVIDWFHTISEELDLGLKLP